MSRIIRLELTEAEASGLLALAEEGAQGLLNDEGAAAAYIGTKAQVDAAERGFSKLRVAVYRTPDSTEPQETASHD